MISKSIESDSENENGDHSGMADGPFDNTPGLNFKINNAFMKRAHYRRRIQQVTDYIVYKYLGVR